VAERVDFLGYVDDYRLPGLYTGADVYVTLSEFEAYGMTVAEALAAGTPCLIRERGALVDWTHNDGVVGITDMSPGTIRTGITEAIMSDPVSDPLQTWAAVTDEMDYVYRD
jgi:glycosyltransferase involved in cell wall biosynthesis